MSPKSAIQLIILIIIFIILGGVYIKYFSKEKIAIDQSSQQTEKEINSNSQDIIQKRVQEQIFSNLKTGKEWRDKWGMTKSTITS